MESKRCMLCRCGRFEKHGMACIIEQRHIGEISNCPLDRLTAYEDAEEQELLVILPVKAGDTVYQLRDKKHALGVGVHPRHISRVCVYGNDWIAEHQGDKPCTKNDFGKTWFLTREEAEAALAKEG